MTCNFMNKVDAEEGRCVWCGEKKTVMHHDIWDGNSYCPCGCEGEKEEKRLKEEIKKAEEQLRDLNLKLREHRKTSLYYREMAKLYNKRDKVENEIRKMDEIKYDVSGSSWELRNMVTTEVCPINITGSDENYGRNKFEVVLD